MTQAIEHAWKIHAALADWTGKVDTKASFALAIEAAVLSGIVALTRPEQPLSETISVLGRVTLICGIGLLGVAATLAILVVIPRIRSRQVDDEWQENYVYFGHVRRWEPQQLSMQLQKDQSEMLLVLSRQLVRMSQIAWIKHRRVQFSLGFAWLGVAATIVAAIVQ